MTSQDKSAQVWEFGWQIKNKSGIINFDLEDDQ